MRRYSKGVFDLHLSNVLFGPLLALLLLLPGCSGPAAESTPAPEPTACPTATPAPTPTPPPAPTVATLAVCGDVMSHMPVTRDAWDEAAGEYDYGPIMAGAAPIVERADFAVANLETTLAGGPGYSGYPAFNSPDALAQNLKDMGFDLLLTANNHCMDKGYKGLERTLDVLDGVGMPHVGTNRSAEEAAEDIYVANVGGISVAFLGYTYGTNGIPLPKGREYAVNLFNTDYLTSLSTPDTGRLLRDLEQARSLETDLIAVMIHWGVEYQTKENAYQRDLADLLIANGADLVLGGHPHVLEPMEVRTVEDEAGEKRSGFVVYSLGNFISSQNKPLTDTTAVLTLELTKDNVTGEAGLKGWTYEPMLMLNRGEGAADRFRLLDAHAELEGGDVDEDLTAKLTQAIEDCHNILGPEQPAFTGMPS